MDSDMEGIVLNMEELEEIGMSPPQSNSGPTPTDATNPAALELAPPDQDLPAPNPTTQLPPDQSPTTQDPLATHQGDLERFSASPDSTAGPGEIPGEELGGWGQEDSEGGLGSDGSDSDQEEPARPWQPITEDVTEPCEDEMDVIVRRGEHSALDHEHWEKQAFFDLDDPELVPGESGRIDWLVEGFNGTAEKPNNEQIMRSPAVRIGGVDWQIKFYPRGDNSHRLSLYIECVSMQASGGRAPEYESTEPFQSPPFPFLEGIGQERKRRSVAAQFSVAMYNPAEPRVYEFLSEAHQFHKGKPDWGWKYFGRAHREVFHIREHGQRQAILRNDQLAFKAYIRIVNDPTGCMWEHYSFTPEDTISLTGLRPFKKSLQYIAGVVPLLHFAPFRKFIQNLPNKTRLAELLQPLLLKMYTRQLSLTYNEHVKTRRGDVMEMIWKISTMLHSENDSALSQQWQELVGFSQSAKGTACGVNRLDTQNYKSIQDAINKHPKSIARPQLLILELTRQEHDKRTRKWKKLTNKVRIDECIQVEDTRYTLFAFITHCGPLKSSRYKCYVRPSIGKGWYAYHDGQVTRLTEKQASDRHSGTKSEDDMDETNRHGRDSPMSDFDVDDSDNEVSCIVMYVREDLAHGEVKSKYSVINHPAPSQEVHVMMQALHL